MLVFNLLMSSGALFDGSDYIAVLSDRVDCGLFKNGAFISAATGAESDFSKLLELRVFNEKAEYRAFRDNLGETKLFQRIASDDNPKYAICFDELQYLDIDSKRKSGNENELFTTGGGAYYLFNKNDKRKVLVRTYLKPGVHGLEYAFDWRIVGYRDAGFTLPGKE